jgi:AcrR family transcriptional regulator
MKTEKKILNTPMAEEQLVERANLTPLDSFTSPIPVPPDANTPQGQIFIAATRLFSDLGFLRTSTRAIAKAAGVKQVMIHYYYSSKELLYEAVLKYEGMCMLAVIFGSNPEEKSPEEMLIDSPIRLMTVLHDNPQWASLLRREIADGAVHLRKALRDVSEQGPLGANLHFHDAYLNAVRMGKAISLPIEAVRECHISCAADFHDQ